MEEDINLGEVLPTPIPVQLSQQGEEGKKIIILEIMIRVELLQQKSKINIIEVNLK